MKENGSTKFVPGAKILNVEARSTACFQIEGEAGGKGVTAYHSSANSPDRVTDGGADSLPAVPPPLLSSAAKNFN